MTFVFSAAPGISWNVCLAEATARRHHGESFRDPFLLLHIEDAAARRQAFKHGALLDRFLLIIVATRG